ncbi:unnamed protein product [Larinioides sclopetarius]|uniref:Uncharacterized protein n=1 Tax=Larinioides sclopetarius TaxID=280406 RepID=A0AAV1YPV3_9ARAC
MTSWLVFETQIDVVSSTNGWTDEVKASHRIPADKLTNLMTFEKALESRFGDGHLFQSYRTELNTRRQKSGERLQVLAADAERLMSLAYAECPQEVLDSLSIRDEDTQQVMDVKDLKSALAYSMKYEAAKTVSKTSKHVRSIEVKDDNDKDKDDKSEVFKKILKTNETLLRRLNKISQSSCWKEKCFSAKFECDVLEMQQKGARTERVPGNCVQSGKLIYGRLLGRRLPFLDKAPKEGLKVSALSGEKNGFYLEGSICGNPCWWTLVLMYAVTDSPSQVLQKGVLAAATLVDLKKDAIPVRVLNLENKPRIVDKGIAIATCEPVIDIVARPQEISESLHLSTILQDVKELNEEQQ